VNRDVQGTALQGGQGIVEIAGIKIYKSMHIPFFGKYGVNYGGAVANPGNTGSFIGQTLEDASDATTGVNNDYGTAVEVGATSCGLKLLVVWKLSPLRCKSPAVMFLLSIRVT
jgi:hypothetical protein